MTTIRGKDQWVNTTPVHHVHYEIVREGVASISSGSLIEMMMIVEKEVERMNAVDHNTQMYYNGSIN